MTKYVKVMIDHKNEFSRDFNSNICLNWIQINTVSELTTLRIRIKRN